MSEPFTELNSLLQDDYDADFAPPSEYAIGEATRLLEAANASSYRASTNGCGNVRLEWKKGAKEVRLVLPKAQDNQSYIYYEEGVTYGLIKNVTADVLIGRLRWLAEESGEYGS